MEVPVARGVEAGAVEEHVAAAAEVAGREAREAPAEALLAALQRRWVSSTTGT